MTIDDEIKAERQRQRDLKAAGKFKYTCADPEPTNFERLSILLEEVHEAESEGDLGRWLFRSTGRLARVLNDRKSLPLRSELVFLKDKAVGYAVYCEVSVSCRAELIQVAAVCDAWLEALDKEQGQ